MHEPSPAGDPHVVAAAPDYRLDVSHAASPELALVDAELAAELRRALRSHVDEPPGLGALGYEPRLLEPALVDESIVGPSEASGGISLDEWPATVGDPPSGRVTADDLIVMPAEELPAVALASSVEIDALLVEPAGIEDVTVPAVDSDERNESSHYPSLPALDVQKTEETDAALRRIREHLAENSRPPKQRRRVRRGFIVASGLVAACSLVGFIAQLPTPMLH